MKTFDLDGKWTLRRVDEKTTIPASVPGCVHMDLLAAGKIPDPFHQDNESTVQWVGDSAWVYARDFDLPAELLEQEVVVLRAEGLDTLASVFINGWPAGTADNMFRTWEFDVKNLLQSGKNRIDIRFDSAALYTRARQTGRYVHGWNDRDGAMYLRKEPCNYGWDWGPKLITCGIWRSIEIAAWNTSRIEDVLVTQHHDESAVTLDVTANLKSQAGSKGSSEKVCVSVAVELDGKVVATGARISKASGPARVELKVRNPQLWYPRGLGDQPLYTIRVDLSTASGTALDSWTKRVGLRVLRLGRHKDEWGESFQFEVNGAPFFAKGGNWIPADAFAPRISDEQYAELLSSSAEVNMNMIRVWGGGIYEAEIFYDLCDELGLCVWQDFMFSCACYPTFDQEFMDNVRAEAKDVVKQLRHHPCIAFWCGNNELEQGLCGPEWSAHQMPWSEYEKLFDKLLPEVVRECDPQRDYWPGSPHSPVGERRECNAATNGDAHLWAVWHGREPFEWYRGAQHRFCSEFGFQSFPEPKTIASFTRPEDRNISSYVMDFHQRSWIGNAAIASYMLSWYRLPGNFETMVWVSQIQQGMAMKYAVEHWRRNMPRTMGALYWQINDTWPGPSWSSIDYFLRWKALQYMARRFFAPVMLSLLEKQNEKSVEVWLSNDRRKAVRGTLRVVVTDCAGNELKAEHKTITLKPLSSTAAREIKLGKELDAQSSRDLLVWAEFEATGEPVTRNLATFTRPKHLKLRAPGLRTKVIARKDDAFDVIVSAKRPALSVWLELTGVDAKYSDNFFDVRPGLPVTVTVTPVRKMTKQDFAAALKIRSLHDAGGYPDKA